MPCSGAPQLRGPAAARPHITLALCPCLLPSAHNTGNLPIQLSLTLSARLQPEGSLQCASPDAGNLPIELSLTVAVATMVLLYMPRSQEVDSPLLQARRLGSGCIDWGVQLQTNNLQQLLVLASQPLLRSWPLLCFAGLPPRAACGGKPHPSPLFRYMLAFFFFTAIAGLPAAVLVDAVRCAVRPGAPQRAAGSQLGRGEEGCQGELSVRLLPASMVSQ